MAYSPRDTTQQALDRVPPQNLAAEQAVLGAMMMDRDAVMKTIEIIRPAAFYRDAHRIIFESMLTLFERGEPIDLVTVTEDLRKKNQLETVGGSVYLADLLSGVPTSSNVESYARIVDEKALLRRLIEVGSQIVGQAFEQPDDVASVLDTAEKKIFEIAFARAKDGFHKIDDVLREVLDKLDKLYGSSEGLSGIPSGYPDLEKLTAGFQKTDLIIIAARPSVGKTALALNIAQNVALRHKIPVAIFSLEMSREQLAQRMLCSEAEVDSQRLKTANLSDVGWKKLTRALGRLTEAPIFIDDTATMTALEIRARARRLKAEKGLGLIMIDYLQLMQGRNKSENRVQEISEIARSLKALARELDVPVIALSQLSRAIEQRPDRMPKLSDLRESGEIEQTADVVMFIHREDYYNPTSEKGNIAEIIVAKQRNGPTGSAELVFRREIARFHSKETTFDDHTF